MSSPGSTQQFCHPTTRRYVIYFYSCTLMKVLGGGIRKWAWSEVQTEQLQWLRVRLQPQNTEDESRGMTKTCTAKSCERSLRSGLAGVVKVGEFSSQILLLQTTGRNELQCRGTVCDVFEVRTKTFQKRTSHFLRNSLFSLKVHVPRNY